MPKHKQEFFYIGKPEFSGPVVQILREFGEALTPLGRYDVDLVPSKGTVIIAANGVRSVGEAKHLLTQRRVEKAFVIVMDHRHLKELSDLASDERRVCADYDGLRAWFAGRASDMAA